MKTIYDKIKGITFTGNKEGFLKIGAGKVELRHEPFEDDDKKDPECVRVYYNGERIGVLGITVDPRSLRSTFLYIKEHEIPYSVSVEFVKIAEQPTILGYGSRFEEGEPVHCTIALHYEDPPQQGKVDTSAQMVVYDMQQRSMEWYAIRQGKITGTKLAQIMGKNWQDAAYSLVAEKETTSESTYTSRAVEWGVDTEPWAIQEYEKRCDKVEQPGFCVSTKNDMLGLSPDGFCQDRTKGLEVKCPDTSTHVKYIHSLKSGSLTYFPTAYKWQIVNYFLVNQKLESLDFLSFDPRYQKQPMCIVTIGRSDIDKELADAETRLDEVRTFLADL